ncbi:MAG: hypothetical protein HQ578_02970 [Chloroflexi bacterium]|nr:hypothetical protein [Chloroflexota bacterium]
MTTAAREVDVVQLVKTHADTWLKFDLLLFWSKYPEAKFTCGIVSRAVRCRRRLDVEEALDYLAGANLLEKHSREGLLLYCLTKDPRRRQCVIDLPAHVGGFRRNWYLAVRRPVSSN